MFRSWLLDVFALMSNRRPKNSRKRARRHRLWLERLEDRTLPSTLTVNIPTDNGDKNDAHTLYWAIYNANQDNDGDVIEFQTSVQPSVAELAISGKVTVMGNNYTLDGSFLSNSGGLKITGNKVTVEGLTITNFQDGIDVDSAAKDVIDDDVLSGNSGDGINISGSGATNDLVENSFIGTDATGTVANGNGGSGVVIKGGASGNTISGNVISGNGNIGVLITDGGTSGNSVFGNQIGTDVSGNTAIPNGGGVGGGGVYVTDGANNNTIGGANASGNFGNTIAGNTDYGVLLSIGSNNLVLGNVIGVAANGAALPNGQDGVYVEKGASDNTIGTYVGGASTDGFNLISGNTGSGVVITGNGTSGNVVQNDWIGINASGSAALGNGGNGVALLDEASGNTIGGTTSADANVVSGNAVAGFDLDTGTTANQIEGNFIGTDPTGSFAIANTQQGVLVKGSAKDNTINGNVISGNTDIGLLITAGGTSGNVVYANYIGTDSASAAIGNAGSGVVISAGASDNTIGAANATGNFGNYIADNAVNGIYITGNGSDDNQVLGNFIGVAPNDAALPNTGDGVEIAAAASDNTIGEYVGGSDADGFNLISGNTGSGVVITGANTSGNVVQNDSIGINASGSGPLANGGDGVDILAGASGNTIGSTTAALANWISGNSGQGILIDGNGTTGNVVSGNRIGTDGAGTAAVANGLNGVVIQNGAAANTIGGSAAGAGNVISGNSEAGVVIQGAGTNQNVIDGNYVGTDDTGSVALGNVGVGVYVLRGAQSNLIGTNGDGVDDAAERNVISANAFQGVCIQGTGTNSNIVAGNYIGTNAAGTAALANGNNGVWICQGAEDNRIGTNGTDTDVAGEANLISGNSYSGVTITDANTSGNLVAGNRIGTDVTGQNPLPNGIDGVYIFDGAANNSIGGSVVLANTIAFNTGAGVMVGDSASDTATTGNSIRANAIFDNGALGIDLGNVGVTTNQPGGPFSGPNDFQNYPVITAASPGTSTTITGTLNGAKNTTFTLDFYASPAPDPSGYGQGQIYLNGTQVVTVKTNGSGNGTFSVTFPVETTENEWITATATDPGGNTSEFSQAVQANTFIPSQLVVTAEPQAPLPEYMPFAFAVTAEDDLGEVATDWTGQVSVTLGTDPTGAALGGTLVLNAVAGVATFNNLTVSAVGTGYVLDASAAGLEVSFGPFNVSRATPTVFVNPVNTTYGTPLANSQLSGTATLSENGIPVNVAGTFAYTSAAGDILSAGSYAEAVTFTPTDTIDFNPVYPTVTVNVAQATPNVSVNPVNITYGTALANAQLTGTATWMVNGSLVSVPGTFSYTSAAGTVLTAGSYTEGVTFTANDTIDYQLAPTSVPVNVAKATPIITWPTPSAIAYGTPLSGTQLDATATWTVGSATGPVAGSFVYSPVAGTVLGAGTQTLVTTFTPTDTIDYYVPASQTVQLVVGKATPIITWPTPSAIVYGTALGGTQLDATASWTVGSTTGPVAGSFTYSPPAGTVLGAGTQTLSTTFTPSDTVDYEVSQQSVQLVVSQATPIINWPTPSGITYGTALSSTQLDATSSWTVGSNTGAVAGSFVYSPAAGTVPGAGAQTLSTTFTPTDTTDYTTATQTVQLVVSKATPIITWPTPSAITYGTPLSSAQLDATATWTVGATTGPVAGSFTYSPPAGTVLGAGTYTLSVTFTPTDTADYNVPAAQTVQLVVNPATPNITWLPTTIVYGTALSSTQLDATASWTIGGITTPVEGSFIYSPPAGTVLGAGTQTLSVTFTPTDAADYTVPETQTTQLVVTPATPIITWPTPGAIVYGTALSSAQLDATSSWTVGGTTGPVAGSFTYSPAAGTILGAGTQTLSTTFTPTDTTDYVAATQSVQLVVGQATPIITWPTPSGIVYGTALSSTQLDASSSWTVGSTTGPVAGSFVYSPAAGAILGAGTQTLSTTFTPTDTVDYTTATQTVQLVVSKATPIITWPTPSAITYGTALSSAQLDATATWTVGATTGPVAGSFTYTPPAGTVLGAGTQTLSVTFTPTDTADYNVPPVQSVQLVVNPATPIITWPTPSAIVYGTPLSSTQLDATACWTIGGVATPVEGSFIYSPPAGAVLGAGTQTLSVTFTPTDTADYTLPPILPMQLIVNQAKPIITWPTPGAIVYGTALSSAQLDATSSWTVGGTTGPVAGSFTYSPAAGTILGAGTQTLSTTFTPTDTTDYVAATQSVQLVVGQATPIITWPTPSGIVYGMALSSTQLDASSSWTVGSATGPVAGSFTYSPAAGTILGAGTQTLSTTFTPTDTLDYSTATQTVQLVVSKATPIITWPTPSAITYGTALSSTQLDAKATWTVGASTGPVAGSFTYTPPAGTVLGAGTQTLSVTFTPTDTADYNVPAAQTVQLIVGQANPFITWTPGPITYGTALGNAQLDATASWTIGGVIVPVEGLFTYSPPAGTILGAGTQTLSVTFMPTDTADYNPQVTQTVQLIVNQATPIITWPTPSAIVYGTALTSTQLDATASWTVGGTTGPVAGSFTYSPAAGTILGAGTQTLSTTFTPTDTTDYIAATQSVQLVVGQATPIITWPTPSGIVYGMALSSTQLDASSSWTVGSATGPVAGSFTYSPAAGTILGAGTQTLSTTFTPTDTMDYSTATQTVQLVVSKATPIITWPTPSAITYGTPLSSTQLDTTATWTVGASTGPVAGSFTYTPPAGTVLGAGTQTLSVTFTPTDTADYNVPAAQTVQLVVNQATPIITWPTPSAIVYGTPLSGAQLDATASWTVGGITGPVDGSFMYTPAAGTILGAGTSMLSATFTPADMTDYSIPVTQSVPLVVNKATPIIAWSTPSAISYGTALSSTQLNATSSWTVGSSTGPVAGVFTYTPASGTVLALGMQMLSTMFTPTDIADYNPAARSVPLVVTAGPAGTIATDVPTFAWPAVTDAARYTLRLTSGKSVVLTHTVTGATTYALSASQALTPGKTYSWTVTPLNAKGKALAPSSPITFTVAPLAAPIGLTFSSATDTFTWQPVTNAGHYTLLLVNGTSGKTVLNVPSVTGATYQLTRTQAKLLKPAITYSWYVTAVSANGKVSVRSAAGTTS